jgi:hypothetical protein
MGRKRMGSVDYTPIIMLGLIGGGLYWLFRPGGFLSSGNAQNNIDIASGNASSVEADLKNAASSGDQQQQSNTALQSIASTIYNTGTDSWDLPLSSSVQDSIVYQMSLIGTMTDLLLVFKYFGTKKLGTHWYSVCLSMGLGCTAMNLFQFLVFVLDTDHLKQVNDDLQGNGVNYIIS